MPTRIRLRRTGRKGQGYFRIVVAHQEMARDGRVVATLGHYNPRTDPATIQVNVEQARAWLNKGATPTDTVRALLRKVGVLGREGAAAAASAAPPGE
jgi:small subunit ribosomal protein S16